MKRNAKPKVERVVKILLFPVVDLVLKLFVSVMTGASAHIRKRTLA